MLRTLALTAAFALVAASASAQAIDKNGKCRDAKGKFAAMSVCKAPAAKKCRDVKTKKFAKCGSAGTEAVPAKVGQLDFSQPGNSGLLALI